MEQFFNIFTEHTSLQAVVAALVKLGVDERNLRAVGKGSHEPIADNKTKEGQAKNRRVEFIKR